MYLFFHLYMFQATSAHHQEGTIVSTHPETCRGGKINTLKKVKKVRQVG
jgi:hypothetical protein